MAQAVKLRSRPGSADGSRPLIGITPQQAGWRYIRFAVRQVAAGDVWRGSTSADELCIVLLEGRSDVSWDGGRAGLGPRKDVFSAYPHALYLPQGTRFALQALERTVVADC